MQTPEFHASFRNMIPMRAIYSRLRNVKSDLCPKPRSSAFRWASPIKVSVSILDTYYIECDNLNFQTYHRFYRRRLETSYSSPQRPRAKYLRRRSDKLCHHLQKIENMVLPTVAFSQIGSDASISQLFGRSYSSLHFIVGGQGDLQ